MQIEEPFPFQFWSPMIDYYNIYGQVYEWGYCYYGSIWIYGHLLSSWQYKFAVNTQRALPEESLIHNIPDESIIMLCCSFSFD